MRELKFKAFEKGEGWYSETFTIENLSTLIGSDNIEIVQFTGLKDKNGKEIYEGDIVKFESFDNSNEERYGYSNGFYYEMIALVKFMPSKGFCLKFIKKTNTDDDNEVLPTPKGYGYITQSRTTLLGNIHENPELL